MIHCKRDRENRTPPFVHIQQAATGIKISEKGHKIKKSGVPCPAPQSKNAGGGQDSSG